jgi:metallo-beta-lactamase family protein
MTTLAFHGAAGTVTGSRFLLDSGEARILVDCGQFQGLKELRLRNWEKPPFNQRELEAVVLTHAHIDHSGMLPRLVKEGFRGAIYATPATADLAEVLLLDAARLQEEDAEYANRKGFSKHRPALPLFTVEDARHALSLFRPLPYGRALALPGMTVRLHNAGHILGAAYAEVEMTRHSHTLVFSGDLGRYDVPLHRDPEPLPACDTLVLESTYGDREHDHEPLLDQLEGAVSRTLARGGIVLIPAFAVARAQLLTLLLGRLIGAGRIPKVPVHIDSPMAIDATEIYRRYANEVHLDEEISGRRGGDLFPETVRFHRTVDESRALNDLRGPRIIISSSGMLSGGRVLHHLRRLGPDPANLILLAGYQAAGTRGRALLEGARFVRVHGGDVEVRARVLNLDGLSAHADRGELLRWVSSGERQPETVFLVHGEPDACVKLKAALARSVAQVTIPRLGQRFELVESGRWRSA